MKSVFTLSWSIRASTQHPAAEQFLDWIEPNDFSPTGRFSHIYIPNYVYVPTKILTQLGKVTLCVTDLHYHLIWNTLYRARQVLMMPINSSTRSSNHTNGLKPPLGCTSSKMQKSQNLASRNTLTFYKTGPQFKTHPLPHCMARPDQLFTTDSFAHWRGS
jgi:hypothetical protein